MSNDQLLAALKRAFGYDSFRPLQEEIITASLAGEDVFALLPTGRGKSLCFQLPALLRSGLTVVASPLIALMKDQVDALQAAGVPATFLNSTLDEREARRRIAGLDNGEFRLLYAAPERLMQASFVEKLRRWNVACVAIDEAHCISEWGHDFRPEYRQLARLRDQLPAAPFIALTATATERVRADIVRQLHLREPRTFVASFNRPNLFYRVASKDRPERQALEFVQERKSESGIIYCLSRKGTEALAARLAANGVAARPYHAGLPDAERSANQEAFLRDDARVICATIAFGMGINKPNVRYVVHYDLPKNIEGYYQETGRAGRDGLPADCLLLFSAGDAAKLSRFIDEASDEHQRRIGREQLQQIIRYGEGAGCRREALLGYFGESPQSTNCGACDNCLEPRETFDGTIAAQKFLSTVLRARNASARNDARFGLMHHVEVLAGADTMRIRRWGHEKLTTYGVGSEHMRHEWAAIGRELLQRGLLRQDSEFQTVDLTEDGASFLKSRRSINLARPMRQTRKPVMRVGEIACDEALFEKLRALRRDIADELGKPAYIVFGDQTLRLMARSYPANDAEFSRIQGVGARKLADFGPRFIAAITSFLSENPRQTFLEPLEAAPKPPRIEGGLSETVEESWRRFDAGESIEEIAVSRGLTVGTIGGHIARAADAGKAVDVSRLLTAEQLAQIRAAFAAHGVQTLKPTFEELGGAIDYGRIGIARAHFRKETDGRARENG